MRPAAALHARAGRRVGFTVGAALALALGLGGAACSGACGGAPPEKTTEAPIPIEAGLMLPAPPPLVQDPSPEPSVGPAAPPKPLNRYHTLTIQRGDRPDCVELRPARPGDDPKDPIFRRWVAGSEGIGVAAIAFFHPAFTKAHPGFDLTAPRRLSPAELLVLAAELAEMNLALLAATDLAAAKARWGKTSLVSELESDAAWKAVRPLLGEAAQGLAARAKAMAAAKESLWVLAY
ncbi:MAG: hypothetical protein IPF92_17860 [Myxococcales bacterium]|nr:hypothetical protein [Myxococcales bacterium]MBL0196119.1 hypothetical protein [Myxococcales bacterium]